MHPFIPPFFRRLCRSLFPALLLWAFAIQSHATPVFEPVQGLLITPENPRASLILASDGNFYGTTYNGGSSGYGTVFRMTPSGTLTTLVNFTSINGGYPRAALVQGSDGNFYGTTSGGDSGGYGTVFRMTPTGTLTTLVNFNNSNGGNPCAALVLGSDGNFYGTTRSGGSGGNGTVFRMTPSGMLITLVNFNNTNGSQPYASLVLGSDGNFYGTTYGGGSFSRGTAFKMTPSGTLTTLAHFVDANSRNPSAALVQGGDGNFYGTTNLGSGSSGYGTVFRMTPAGTLTTLVNFTSANGRNPYGSLVLDGHGNFYGTTYEGGSNGNGSGSYGYGTIFKMTPSGTLTTLVHFNSTNGSHPYAALVRGSDGIFYGTTETGGSSSPYGTVFTMTPSGTLTTLVNFASANGRNPYAGLVQGSDGNLYGTTYEGGSSGFGTAFKMTASGTLITLVNFNSANGRHPHAALVQGSDGNFYGTTTAGGSGNNGTVFRMTASGTLTTLVHFDSTNGRVPNAALVQDSNGDFYGTTYAGGSSDYGTIFRMTPSGTLTTLVHFDSTNGRNPRAGLIQSSDGNFYGTTYQGGSASFGTVFRMTPSGTLTTLVNFTSANGRQPYAGLIHGSDGNFYGTTYQGGSSGKGTVFQMTPSGTLSTLVNFTSTNGSHPCYAGLIQASDGNLYGTTLNGGSTPDGQLAGGGQIFRLRMDTYSSWSFGRFSSAQLADPLVSGPNADPDGDGIGNQLECAFNLPPLSAGNPVLTAGTGTVGLPRISAVGSGATTRLRIEYIRRKTGLIYTPQVSSALDGTWSAATGTETVESIDAGWERVTVQEDGTGQPACFGRVKVSSSGD